MPRENRTVKYSAFIIAAAVILASCAAGTRQPGTARIPGLTGDSIQARYHSEFYIVRSGRGKTQEEAAEYARFEIVKFFESRITGETRLRQTSESAVTRGRIVESILTELENEVSVSSEREIPGIEIVENAQVPGSGLYEAWAALSKKEYGALLAERVRTADTTIDTRLGSPGASDIERARTLAGISRIVTERERDRRDLSLVMPEAGVESREALFGMVSASLDSLLEHAIDVGVVLGGDMDDRIRPTIVDGITGSGIRMKEFDSMASAVNGGSDMIVTANIVVTPRVSETTIASQTVKLFWSDWVLSLTAIDPSSKALVDTIVLTDKASGRDPDQALQRMIGRISETQTPAMARWIYDVIIRPEK
jgi:hypothetical protein